MIYMTTVGISGTKIFNHIQAAFNTPNITSCLSRRESKADQRAGCLDPLAFFREFINVPQYLETSKLLR